MDLDVQHWPQIFSHFNYFKSPTWPDFTFTILESIIVSSQTYHSISLWMRISCSVAAEMYQCSPFWMATLGICWQTGPHWSMLRVTSITKDHRDLLGYYVTLRQTHDHILVEPCVFSWHQIRHQTCTSITGLAANIKLTCTYIYVNMLQNMDTIWCL